MRVGPLSVDTTHLDPNVETSAQLLEQGVLTHKSRDDEMCLMGRFVIVLILSCADYLEYRHPFYSLPRPILSRPTSWNHSIHII